MGPGLGSADRTHFGSGSGSGLPTCNSDQAWVEQYMARPSQVAPLLRSTSVDQVIDFTLFYEVQGKDIE